MCSINILATENLTFATGSLDNSNKGPLKCNSKRSLSKFNILEHIVTNLSFNYIKLRLSLVIDLTVLETNHTLDDAHFILFFHLTSMYPFKERVNLFCSSLSHLSNIIRTEFKCNWENDFKNSVWIKDMSHFINLICN